LNEQVCACLALWGDGQHEMVLNNFLVRSPLWPVRGRDGIVI
jgi:hypothetical protein